MESQNSKMEKLKEARTYQFGKKKSNPGKNFKGKKTVKSHHAGKIKQQYIKNSKARATCLSSRKKTMFKKADEIYKLTNTEAYVHLITESKQNVKYGSPSIGKMYDDLFKRDEQRPSTSAAAHGPIPEFPSPHRRPVAVNVSEMTQTSVSFFRKVDSNRCAECHIERDGEGDKEKGPWVGCDVPECTYWAHFSCHGFYPTARQLKGIEKN